MADPNSTSVVALKRVHGAQYLCPQAPPRPGRMPIDVRTRTSGERRALQSERNGPLPVGVWSASNELGDRQRAFEALRTVSERLLEGNRSERETAAERSFLQLGGRLSVLVGAEGYRALVTRALQLAASEFPQLNAVRPAMSPPGRLVGLHNRTRRAATADVQRALTATLAALFWLLEQFIGKDLTCTVLSEVWPWLADYANAN